jgi:glycosyltransferase involved in cell wall biosynthesis
MSLKVMWCSNSPHTGTGYGIPTRHVVQHLKNLGHEVAIQAFYGVQGNALNWGDVTLYPGQGHIYGADAIGAHARHFGAELVVTLIDNWVLPNQYHKAFECPWLEWFPVDGEPVPEKSIYMARQAEYPAVFSQHGVHAMHAAGVNVNYLPYGIDCSIFKPRDKAEAREELGLDPDVWLAVTVAANKGYPARKAWPEILMAWREFSSVHDDVALYLHTRIKHIAKEGIDFVPLIKSLGLDGKVAFADQDALAVGYDNDDLATLYQAADVMLLPSMGEGFGLPVAEAQACGCPVITQACSSMTELTVNGIAIPAGQPFWVPVLNYWWHTPRVGDIVAALDAIYSRGDDEVANAQGAAFFHENYDWPVLFEQYWSPLLERIEAERW